MTTPLPDSDGVDRVKVRYALPPGEDDWPPVAVEDLWAIRLSPEVVRIDSIPWFVRGLALNDLVQVSGGDDGVLHPVEKLRWSGNCTIRVIPLDDDDNALRQMQTVIDRFARFGVDGEGLGQFGMVALNVPPDADIRSVKELLSHGMEQGLWDFEEGCVGGAWD